MFDDKEVRVVLSNEADEEYKALNKIVGEERKKGIDSSIHQSIFRSIERVKNLLKENPFAGEQVQKRKLPAKYVKKYGANNVWRIDLANRWRLVYTITGNKVEIITFVLDIFDHKKYDKVFGYKH